jgi:hypothetical protein
MRTRIAVLLAFGVGAAFGADWNPRLAALLPASDDAAKGAWTKWPGLLTAEKRKAIVHSALVKQAAKGGWTLDSMGPWKPHPNAVPSSSMNKHYEPDSMQVQFMSDAATGFASLALLAGQ